MRWYLSNVLVGGRRVSGEAGGRDEQEAVRHLAAVEARSRKIDVASAIAGALRDTYKKVSLLDPAVAREADRILPPSGRSELDYTAWPAMLRGR